MKVTPDGDFDRGASRSVRPSWYGSRGRQLRGASEGIAADGGTRCGYQLAGPKKKKKKRKKKIPDRRDQRAGTGRNNRRLAVSR